MEGYDDRRAARFGAGWVALAMVFALGVAPPAWAQKKGGSCSLTGLASANASSFTLVTPLNVAGSGKRLGLSLAAARATISCGSASVDAVIVAAGSAWASSSDQARVEVFFLNPTTGQPLPNCPPLALPVPTLSNNGENTVWTIDFGDINGDQVPDFVTTSRYSQQAWAYVAGSTAGTITYGGAIAIPRPASDTGGSFAYSAAVGDLDGSTGDEIAIGAPGSSSKRSPAPGEIMLYKFTGTAFTHLTTLQAPPNDAHWNFGYSVAIGEVADGGLPDVVASAMSQTVAGVKGAGAVYIYSQGASGTWPASPSQLRAATLADESYGYRVAIGDLGSSNASNGHLADGTRDVIATTGWGGPDTRLDITLGPVTNGELPATSLALRPDTSLGGGWGTGEPTCADVNDDGDPDVFIGAMNATHTNACISPGVAYAFLSNGDGTMTSYRLAAPSADADFAGYGRWVVGVDGTPLVLVTEQGRNFADAATTGQIYVYRAP